MQIKILRDVKTVEPENLHEIFATQKYPVIVARKKRLGDAVNKLLAILCEELRSVIE